MPDGEWSYTTFGATRHWRLRKPDGVLSVLAICFSMPMYPAAWHGNGTKEEKEKLAKLRACKNCMKRGAPDGLSAS